MASKGTEDVRGFSPDGDASELDDPPVHPSDLADAPWADPRNSVLIHQPGTLAVYEWPEPL